MSNLKQIDDEEHEFLYSIIREEKPEICFECGTSNGEGSTYSIASGLFDNKKGKLYTFEVKKDRFDIAKDKYSNEFKHLEEYVVLNNSESIAGMPQCNIDAIDFAFIDGPHSPSRSFKIFMDIEDRVKKNGVVVLHDWYIKKCRIMKKWLPEHDDRWQIELIKKTKTGICKIRKI